MNKGFVLGRLFRFCRAHANVLKPTFGGSSLSPFSGFAERLCSFSIQLSSLFCLIFSALTCTPPPFLFACKIRLSGSLISRSVGRFWQESGACLLVWGPMRTGSLSRFAFSSECPVDLAIKRSRAGRTP